jgi:hypothetical protein
VMVKHERKAHLANCWTHQFSFVYTIEYIRGLTCYSHSVWSVFLDDFFGQSLWRVI